MKHRQSRRHRSRSQRRLLSRRSFLAAASVAGTHWGTSRAGCAQTESDPASFKARRKAAWQRRPLIMDDDGDMVYAKDTIQGPEEFLKLRMHDCRDAGINSIAWCIMWGIAQQRNPAARYWQTQMKGVPFQNNMPDPTPVIAKFCRENKIEVFGSIRMNDSHDAFGYPFPKLVYPLKVEHPEMLIGNESQRGAATDGLAAAMWSGMDYAHQKVRDDRLWWIENTASRYDLDGVDLNFFRMPWCFKPGEEEKNMPLMTDFIRQARKRLDEVSRRRGRPVLLGVRVPGTIETCNRIGFDIEAWLKEGLIDRMLTGGGYVCYSTPAEELIKLGHRYEVPVYPCINCPANYTLGGNSLRAAASNFWSAGADGIYLWNFQYISAPGSLGYGRPSPDQYRKHLPEIADPRRLKYLDKSFAVNQRVWEQYQRASASAPLPLSLVKGSGEKPSQLEIRIGDDIQAARKKEKLKDVTLKLQMTDAVPGDQLNIRFNNYATLAPVISRNNWLAFPLPPETIKMGANQLTLDLAKRGETAFRKIIVNRVRVDVQYHKS
jgi:hypothetical protein